MVVAMAQRIVERNVEQRKWASIEAVAKKLKNANLRAGRNLKRKVLQPGGVRLNVDFAAGRV